MVNVAKQWYAGCMTELNLTIDHVSLSVEDLERAKNFYSKALAPLGMEIVGEVTAERSGSVGFVGFGVGRKGSLWLAQRGRQTPTTHICFRAPTRVAVRDFHAAALGAGAKDNGGPGVRPEYHESYYAAFVLSPEGHNIEAVCFEGES
jgi:catechol 2,3-dioxygenase-like lactoylglutathione lyase family enzyme